MIKYVENKWADRAPTEGDTNLRNWDIICTAHDEPMFLGRVWYELGYLIDKEYAIIGEHINEEHSLIVDREEL